MRFDLDIRKPRSFLGLPFLAIQLALIGLGFLMVGIGRLTRIVNTGIRDHAFMPVMLARRIVIGQPYWQPGDLAVGRQPTRAKDIAAARANPELVEIPLCNCGEAACPNAGKLVFVHKIILGELPLSPSQRRALDEKLERAAAELAAVENRRKSSPTIEKPPAVL